MLLGIVAKNSILLIDFAIEEMAKGVPKYDAIIDAGHKRAQPIVMTTVAMVAGMVPTALSLVGRRQLARADGRHRDRRPDPVDHADAGDRAGRLQPRRSASRSGSAPKLGRMLTYRRASTCRRPPRPGASERGRVTMARCRLCDGMSRPPLRPCRFQPGPERAADAARRDRPARRDGGDLRRRAQLEPISIPPGASSRLRRGGDGRRPGRLVRGHRLVPPPARPADPAHRDHPAQQGPHRRHARHVPQGQFPHPGGGRAADAAASTSPARSAASCQAPQGEATRHAPGRHRGCSPTCSRASTRSGSAAWSRARSPSACAARGRAAARPGAGRGDHRGAPRADARRRRRAGRRATLDANEELIREMVHEARRLGAASWPGSTRSSPTRSSTACAS